MKVSSISCTYHGYYYQKNETKLNTRTSKTIKSDAKLIEETQSAYQTPISNNSAEYVKNAYQVSFRPHDLIVNLQEA